MEFRRIEYFLVLAEKLNFNAAAKELCISTPALTKQIHLLEEELGARLFERSTRHVSLTEEGVFCQNQFSSVKAHYDEALSMVEESIRRKQHTVKISFFAPLPRNQLMNPVIHGLSAEFPDFDTLLIELEKGRGFAVFPQAFNEMDHSQFSFYDPPEELAFNFHTMAACSSANRNPDVRRVLAYLKKNKESYFF